MSMIDVITELANLLAYEDVMLEGGLLPGEHFEINAEGSPQIVKDTPDDSP